MQNVEKLLIKRLITANRGKLASYCFTITFSTMAIILLLLSIKNNLYNTGFISGLILLILVSTGLVCWFNCRLFFNKNNNINNNLVITGASSRLIFNIYYKTLDVRINNVANIISLILSLLFAPTTLHYFNNNVVGDSNEFMPINYNVLELLTIIITIRVVFLLITALSFYDALKSFNNTDNSEIIPTISSKTGKIIINPNNSDNDSNIALFNSVGFNNIALNGGILVIFLFLMHGITYNNIRLFNNMLLECLTSFIINIITNANITTFISLILIILVSFSCWIVYSISFQVKIANNRRKHSKIGCLLSTLSWNNSIENKSFVKSIMLTMLIGLTLTSTINTISVTNSVSNRATYSVAYYANSKIRLRASAGLKNFQPELAKSLKNKGFKPILVSANIARVPQIREDLTYYAVKGNPFNKSITFDHSAGKTWGQGIVIDGRLAKELGAKIGSKLTLPDFNKSAKNVENPRKTAKIVAIIDNPVFGRSIIYPSNLIKGFNYSYVTSVYATGKPVNTIVKPSMFDQRNQYVWLSHADVVHMGGTTPAYYNLRSVYWLTSIIMALNLSGLLTLLLTHIIMSRSLLETLKLCGFTRKLLTKFIMSPIMTATFVSTLLSTIVGTIIGLLINSNSLSLFNVQDICYFVILQLWLIIIAYVITFIMSKIIIRQQLAIMNKD